MNDKMGKMIDTTRGGVFTTAVTFTGSISLDMMRAIGQPDEHAVG